MMVKNCFVFDLVIFSFINDYYGVSVVLDELKVDLSWSSDRFLIIMHSLIYSWQQACYLCILGLKMNIECVI